MPTMMVDEKEESLPNMENSIYLEFFDEHHSFYVPIRGYHDDSGMPRIEGTLKDWYRIRKSVLSDYRFSFLGADWYDVAVVSEEEVRRTLAEPNSVAAIIPWTFAQQFFDED